MKLSEEIENLLKVKVGEKGWEVTLKDLDRSGGVTSRVFIELFALLITKVEELENEQDSKPKSSLI